MRETVRSKFKLAAVILVLAVAVLGTVIAGDVIVKEGVVEGVKFKSTDCTATGAKAVAFGMDTIASGDYSFAAGWGSAGKGAIGSCCVATGYQAKASGYASTAMGYYTNATADYATAFGRFSTNNATQSFTVGYGFGPLAGAVDLRVEYGLVTVGNVAARSGNLYVGNKVDAHTYATHSSFYDKDTYGRALGYIEDCSKTITINAKGEKEYNHEADPEFLKTWVTVKDYDKYTDKKVWNEESQEYETERIYETHQELRTDLGMQVAWLRQCAYELKQENEMLKAELAAIKAKLGME